MCRNSDDRHSQSSYRPLRCRAVTCQIPASPHANGRPRWSDVQVIEPRVLCFGTPVILISTENEDGSANLSPMSSAWWVDQSCMLGLDASSQTTSNLQRTGELVLNLPDSSMVDAVDRVAMFTGSAVVPAHKAAKGYRHLADKFGVGGLTPIASELVRPPRVAECPIQMETTVQQIHPLAGTDSGLVTVEVSIVRTYADPALLVDGSDRHIDPERWDPLIMKFCHFYGRGVNLRSSRLADGWQIPTIPQQPARR
jgi:flavin reductase (DIM6/NTAB) family NADH-FMN oxidoreductase RutF